MILAPAHILRELRDGDHALFVMPTRERNGYLRPYIGRMSASNALLDVMVTTEWFAGIFRPDSDPDAINAALTRVWTRIRPLYAWLPREPDDLGYGQESKDGATGLTLAHD